MIKTKIEFKAISTFQIGNVSADIHFNSCVAPGRSAVDLHAVKSAVGVSMRTEEQTSALKLIRSPSFGHAMVLKLKVKDPLLTKQGNWAVSYILTYPRNYSDKQTFKT